MDIFEEQELEELITEENIDIDNLDDFISNLEESVKEHQFKVINGVLVDVQTANVILLVHKNLKPKQLAVFEEYFLKSGVAVIGGKCWNIISRSSN